MSKVLDLSGSSLIAVRYTSANGFQLEIESIQFGLMQIQLGHPECYIQKQFENPIYQDGVYIDVESRLIQRVYEQSFETLPLEKCLHISIVISGLKISGISVVPPKIQCIKEPYLAEEVYKKIESILGHREISIDNNNSNEDDCSFLFERIFNENLDAIHKTSMSQKFQRPINIDVINLENGWIEFIFTSGSSELKHHLKTKLVDQQFFCIDELIYYNMLRRLRENKPEIGPIYEISNSESTICDKSKSPYEHRIRIEDTDYIIDFLQIS